ncbi:PcfJ-like protein [Desulfonatronum zhilinae]|nr:PcfJ-like protein [Desulfonatronum zhilinae]
MNAGFRPPDKGTVFKPEAGKLYQFNPGSIAVLRAWPKPLAWKKTRRRPGWVHFRPAISFARPGGDSPQTDNAAEVICPFYRFSETIPEQIRAAVTRFPKRQWHMLSFLARCGNAARDLTAANPALAFALASNWVFHAPAVQRPMRSARTLATKKQRYILAWLGFPGSESARKVLIKVRCSALTIPAMLYLRQALSDPVSQKLMAHAPSINPGVLRMVTDQHLLPYVTLTLLEDVSNQPMEEHYPVAAYLLRDILCMLEELPVAFRLAPMRSLAVLRNVHDNLVGDLNDPRRSSRHMVFPEPPLPGNDSIIPITTRAELAEEGRHQHNCVACYSRRVQNGQAYIYRVLHPERCTVALTRKGDTWMVSEVKRDKNMLPSSESVRAVARWFAAKNDNVGENEDLVPF